MKYFVKLFYDLEQTNQQQEKINLICNYLHQVDDEEKIWMLALFTGRRPRRMATTLLQKKWALERCELPEWLFDECYAAVGDMAETISLLLPATEKSEEHSLSFWIKYILALEEKDEDERKLAVLNAWDKLSNQERYIFNKIVSVSMIIHKYRLLSLINKQVIFFISFFMRSPLL
jgi:DNA ligase-1